MHCLWKEVHTILLEGKGKGKEMNRTEKSEKEVDKILKSIENLSGKKEILIKTVFLRIGVMMQSIQYFRYNFENSNVENIGLNEVANFLKIIDKNTKNYQEYIEETIKMIEDFNKKEENKNED